MGTSSKPSASQKFVVPNLKIDRNLLEKFMKDGG